MTTELTISGMTSGHCQTAVTRALMQVPGVQNAQVDRTSGLAIVEGEAAVQALRAAVMQEGYSAQLRQPKQGVGLNGQYGLLPTG
jgi:copper chaperone